MNSNNYLTVEEYREANIKLAERFDRIDDTIQKLISQMPNKEDYVTRVEFNEFKKEFHNLQEIVLKIYDVVHIELIVRNRQIEAKTNNLDSRVTMLEEICHSK